MCGGITFSDGNIVSLSKDNTFFIRPLERRFNLALFDKITKSGDGRHSGHIF